jgi:hypothetical protein
MVMLFRRLIALVSLSLLVIGSQAQSGVMEDSIKKQKPYKLVTTGRQITIKSIKGIKQVMLWTTSGNRVVEQLEINNQSWVLDIPVSQKTFFLMIGLADGKIYTEKIGIQ